MPVINDIEVQEPVPVVTNNYSGTLVILGGARCVWEDFKNFKELIGPRKYAIMAINDIGIQIRRDIDHMVSLHWQFLPAAKLLKPVNAHGHFHTHGDKHHDGVDFVWPIENVGGTSAMYACKVAILLGYTKIVICGVPLDGSGHYFDPPDAEPDNHFNDYAHKHVWAQFKDNTESARNRIRSFSGSTRDTFGLPTEVWLNSNEVI